MSRYAAQTQVSSEKSRAEIERDLRRYGASRRRWEGHVCGYEKRILAAGGSPARAEENARMLYADQLLYEALR